MEWPSGRVPAVPRADAKVSLRAHRAHARGVSQDGEQDWHERERGRGVESRPLQTPQPVAPVAAVAMPPRRGARARRDVHAEATRRAPRRPRRRPGAAADARRRRERRRSGRRDAAAGEDDIDDVGVRARADGRRGRARERSESVGRAEGAFYTLVPIRPRRRGER
eukprot:31335-Pelagococcus_subviridis.AAC.8